MGVRRSRKGILNPNYKGKDSGSKQYHVDYSRQHPLAAKKYVAWYSAKSYSLRDEYKNRPCMDCKVTFPSYVMHFDHRDGSIKLFNVGAMAGRVSHDRLLNEILKCDVVCANCHAIRTHNRRIKCGS